MIFNFFSTERVFRVAQYDGINDFVPFDLSGEKRALVQFLVGEFHSSTICKRFDPLVAHSAPPNGGSVEIIRALKTQTHESVSYGPWHMVDEIKAIALIDPSRTLGSHLQPCLTSPSLGPSFGFNCTKTRERQGTVASAKSWDTMSHAPTRGTDWPNHL